MGRLKIAALGSSFAAGPGIEPTIDSAALRSGNNYAHQLAEKLDADLTDLTVSGATLLNVLNEPQTTRSGVTFPPQLSSLPPDADIVTLTGGGNDIGYIGGLLTDSLINSTGPLQYLLRTVGFGAPPPAALTPDDLAQRFVDIIDKIHEIASRAKVYLVEYLSTVNSATTSPWSADVPLTAEHIQRHHQAATALRTGYTLAAQRRADSGVVLIEAAKASEGHEVGTAQPWMAGFNLSMVGRALWTKGLSTTPWHPNLAGHTAVAEMLAERVKRNFATG